MGINGQDTKADHKVTALESVGQLCTLLGDPAAGSGRPVCWVGRGGKVGGNIVVVVGGNTGACTAGARLRGWR